MTNKASLINPIAGRKSPNVTPPGINEDRLCSSVVKDDFILTKPELETQSEIQIWKNPHLFRRNDSTSMLLLRELQKENVMENSGILCAISSDIATYQVKTNIETRHSLSHSKYRR